MNPPYVTVKQLRDALAELPGDAIVVVDYGGMEEADITVPLPLPVDSDGCVVIAKVSTVTRF